MCVDDLNSTTAGALAHELERVTGSYLGRLSSNAIMALLHTCAETIPNRGVEWAAQQREKQLRALTNTLSNRYEHLRKTGPDLANKFVLLLDADDMDFLADCYDNHPDLLATMRDRHASFTQDNDGSFRFGQVLIMSNGKSGARK